MTAVNEIAKVAKENAEKLYRSFEGKGDNAEKLYRSKALWWAWENENDIQNIAEELQRALNSATRRIEEAQQYLIQNCPSCLNSCGTMQGLNHDIDVKVAQLQMLIKNRSQYNKILNS